MILVDFTDPAMPRILDQFNQGTSVWEAWYYNGYVFTGDGRRGLDVLAFELGANPPPDQTAGFK